MNIDKYIGMNYDTHNNNGVNCWGLVALVYSDLLSLQIKDFPIDSSDHKTVAATFAAAFASGDHGFKPVDICSDYDVVVFHRDTKLGRLYHCGIMIGGKVLHANSSIGKVVYQRIGDAMLNYKGVGFWRQS